MHDRDAYDEDLRAELGYSYASEREVKLREWNDTREDTEFEALCRRLVQTKHNKKRWQRALVDPEFRAYLDALKKRHAQSPKGREMHRRALHRWRERERAKVRGTVYTCAECGAQWCRIAMGGPRPRYCSNACRQRGYYHARRAGARRVTPRGYTRPRRAAA